MKKYTIEDLANRKVATFITDESQIPDLERLLRLAFPKDSFDNYDNYLKASVNEYYFTGKYDNNFWTSFRETDLPKQHVKDFLTDLEEDWEPKPGEICLVNYGGKKVKLEFFAKTDYNKNLVDLDYYIFYNIKKTNVIFSLREYIEPLPQKLKLTLKQIADKFGVEVDRLEVVND